jgi:proton-dependent oligopeptide transporter, POT family
MDTRNIPAFSGLTHSLHITYRSFGAASPSRNRTLGTFCISYGLQRHAFFVLSIVSVFYFRALVHGDDAHAQLYHSYFFASLYLAPMIFGALITTFRAQRRAVYLGACFLMLACASLAFGANGLMCGALLFAGIGLLNANFRTVFSHTMDPYSGSSATSMTWLYLAGNIGSLLATLIVTDGIQKTGPTKVVFTWCLACLLLSVFFWWRASDRSGRAGAAIKEQVAAPEIEEHQGSSEIRMAGILLATAFAILFWLGFDLKRGRITLDANRWMAHHWLGIPVSGVNIQCVNPLFIILTGGLFARLWANLRRRGRDPHPATKMAGGLVSLGIGFVILASGLSLSGSHLVSPAWFVVMYVCHSVGELCFEPIGQDFVIASAPPGSKALFLAVWDAAESAAYFFGGIAAVLEKGLSLYWILGSASIGAGCLLVVFRKRMFAR